MCVQTKGHCSCNFLTSWSVESTYTARTQIQPESKIQYQEKRKWALLCAEVRERGMGWFTRVSAVKRDISFLIFLPTEAEKVPTNRTSKSDQNQRVSITKTNIGISLRWAPAKKSWTSKSFEMSSKRRPKIAKIGTYLLLSCRIVRW